MGTNTNAADAAQASDAARQQGIQRSVDQINTAYTSPQRQAQYDSYGKNLNDYYTKQVNDAQEVNARNLKFAIARNGQTGGSFAVDANGQLNKDYTKGLLQASQQAQAGRSALQQADINAKNQQISLAEQGAYTGANATAAGQAMGANLDAAKGYTNTNALGNLFQGSANIYQNATTAAANRRAQQLPVGSIYGGSSGTSQFGG